MLGAFFFGLPGVGLARAYAWSVLVHELVMVGVMYGAARIHFGRWAGLMAGVLALCDPGDWWVGGNYSRFEIGMWIQALATALLLGGLALWPLAAESGRWRLALPAGAAIGRAIVASIRRWRCWGAWLPCRCWPPSAAYRS